MAPRVFKTHIPSRTRKGYTLCGQHITQHVGPSERRDWRVRPLELIRQSQSVDEATCHARGYADDALQIRDYLREGKEAGLDPDTMEKNQVMTIWGAFRKRGTERPFHFRLHFGRGDYVVAEDHEGAAREWARHFGESARPSDFGLVPDDESVDIYMLTGSSVATLDERHHAVVIGMPAGEIVKIFGLGYVASTIEEA